jgi:hypothetical protein
MINGKMGAVWSGKKVPIEKLFDFPDFLTLEAG